MAGVLNILAANYKAVGLSVPSRTPYVAVDPASYEGVWKGKYADAKEFTVTVSNVAGFRAKVKYQSGDKVRYQDVLIKDNAFRVGDSKFTLTGKGKAQVKTVNIDPANGASVIDTAYVTRSR